MLVWVELVSLFFLSTPQVQCASVHKDTPKRLLLVLGRACDEAQSKFSGLTCFAKHFTVPISFVVVVFISNLKEFS